MRIPLKMITDSKILSQLARFREAAVFGSLSSLVTGGLLPSLFPQNVLVLIRHACTWPMTVRCGNPDYVAPESVITLRWNMSRNMQAERRYFVKARTSEGLPGIRGGCGKAVARPISRFRCSRLEPSGNARESSP
jgi:hypothetical protein